VQGAFGSVWRARWRGHIVAVKQAREDKSSLADAAALVDKAERLAALPPHPHVLVRIDACLTVADSMRLLQRLYGVCNAPLCIVTEVRVVVFVRQTT
jgi:hypothetical protein